MNITISTFNFTRDKEFCHEDNETKANTVQRVFSSPLHAGAGQHGADMRQSPSGRQRTTQSHCAGVSRSDPRPFFIQRPAKCNPLRLASHRFAQMLRTATPFVARSSSSQSLSDHLHFAVPNPK
jgi:hypothetical protein